MKVVSKIFGCFLLEDFKNNLFWVVGTN